MWKVVKRYKVKFMECSAKYSFPGLGTAKRIAKKGEFPNTFPSQVVKPLILADNTIRVTLTCDFWAMRKTVKGYRYGPRKGFTIYAFLV